MNSNNFLELAQKGFRVTVGAAASLLETLQDPQQPKPTFSDFTTDFDRTVEKWEQKGEVTEAEARRTIDELIARQRQGNPPEPVNAPSSTPSSGAETGAPDVQSELQDLTARIAALGLELEELRKSDSP